MLPLLTAPWALAALAALPALAALYWLRNTWREVPVSSLMLWRLQTEAKASGLRMRRLQTPLLFFLELVALILLALAATGPRVDTGQGRWPLVVVLDDSFSMLAGADDSARRLAEEALQRELRWGEDQPVRFLLAGDPPQTLGDMVWSWPDARDALAEWRCLGPVARLSETTALARELNGDTARILVITDHAPQIEPGEGRMQWWAFGQPRNNLAFVNAARSTREGPDRCLLEIANFSTQPQTTTLVLESAAGERIHESTLTLRKQETQRVTLRLPPARGPMTARLGDDALPLDNQVVLLPEETPSVRVEVKMSDKTLQAHVEKALLATGRATSVGQQSQLLITDDVDPQIKDPDTWLVQILAEKEADPYVGPFVLDRTHPLTEGVELAGVVWGAGKPRDFPGAPIILAGGVPLITDSENLAGQHHLRVRLRPDLSTLLDSPAWPILAHNLIQWRAAELPGLRRANLRLGESALVMIPLGVESVAHTPPQSATRLLPVNLQRVILRPDITGLHEIEVGPSLFRVAVNALRREESDLSPCVTGRWGQWSEDVATAPALHSLAWIPLLLVLVVLTLHMALAFRAGK